jgi:hypothetical protein
MLTIVGMPFFAAHPESLQGTLRASDPESICEEFDPYGELEWPDEPKDYDDEETQEKNRPMRRQGNELGAEKRKMSIQVALQVTEWIERLSNIHHYRESQRLCGSEQLLRHRLVADDLHDPPYLALDLPVDHDAVFQGAILRSLLSADAV